MLQTIAWPTNARIFASTTSLGYDDHYACLGGGGGGRNSRVINLLLTKLARDRTKRISALGLFCTDLAALGPGTP